MIAHQAIIVAIDFSELSERAVERAAQLSIELQCPLHLVHAFNPFSWRNLPRLLDEFCISLRRKAFDSLHALRTELVDRYPSLKVECAILDGHASEAIAQNARAVDAGLIVLGAHGDGLVRELALGGTAIKVLRASHCPVLVVRREVSSPYARVLVGVDFSEQSARAMLAAIELCPNALHRVLHAYLVAFEGRMHLAGATDEDIKRYREQERTQAQNDLDAFVANCHYRGPGGIEKHLVYGHAASILNEQAGLGATDLIAIGKHGGSAFDERLLGSITLNVMHHAACDVLMVP